jgi:hypothetical protein
MPDEPPEAEKPEPERVLGLSEDLPLTIFVGVSTAVVFSLINLSSEWTLLGVATAPLVADVLKNYVAGRWTKRRLLVLTALLVFFSRVKEALARVGLRPIPPAGRPRRYAIATTAAVGSALTIVAFTVPELARGEALLVDRKTTFFGGDLEGGTRRLVIAREGNGAGTVTTVPPGIDCGATCAVKLPAGQRVVLTATAGARAVFTGWRGGGCSGTAPCSVTMDDDVSVVAAFRRIHRTVSLSVSKSGDGAGTVTSDPSGIDCGATCSASFPKGRGVTLVARADPGSAFAGWIRGECEGSGSCLLNLRRGTHVTAVFRRVEETTRLAVDLSGDGAGTVLSDPSGIDCEPRCAAEFPRGQKVTLSARAEPGSTFTGWSGGGCSGLEPCAVVLEEETTVVATFERAPQPTVDLTVSVEGTGDGTVTSTPSGILCEPGCSASFPVGESVTLTAAEAQGSAFVGWRGIHCAGTGPCVVTMTNPQRVVAVFAVKPTTYTLTVTIIKGSGLGTVISRPGGIRCEPTCSASFRSGLIVRLIARPSDPTAYLSSWGGDCSGSGFCSVRMDRDRAVTAAFSSVE